MGAGQRRGSGRSQAKVEVGQGKSVVGVRQG